MLTEAQRARALKTWLLRGLELPRLQPGDPVVEELHAMHSGMCGDFRLLACMAPPDGEDLDGNLELLESTLPPP